MMKKALLSAAVAAALPVSAFAVGPIDGTIYGKANVSVVDFGDIDRKDAGVKSTEDGALELTSNSSRVGVKGKTELSEGLYAVYKLEYETFFDDGKSSSSSGSDTFEQRNIYIGLSSSSWGTVIAGKHDTPLKLSQEKADVFGDMPNADIKSVISGDERVSNIIMYSAPLTGGFSATIATILGEGDEETDGTSTEEYDGAFDSLSMVLGYKADNFYVNVAVDRETEHDLIILPETVDTPSSNELEYDQRTDAVRLTGGVTLGGLALNAMYQNAENANNADGVDKEFDAYLLSGAYKMGNVTLKAQYVWNEGDWKTKTTGAKSESETTSISVGADYKLAKNTKLFAYYNQLDFEVKNKTAGTKIDADQDTFGVGIEHKF